MHEIEILVLFLKMKSEKFWFCTLFSDHCLHLQKIKCNMEKRAREREWKLGKRKASALSGALGALSSHWTELEILPAPSAGLGRCSPNCHNLDSWDSSLLPHVDSALEIDARQREHPANAPFLPPRSWVTRASHDPRQITTFQITYLYLPTPIYCIAYCVC